MIPRVSYTAVQASFLDTIRVDCKQKWRELQLWNNKVETNFGKKRPLVLLFLENFPQTYQKFKENPNRLKKGEYWWDVKKRYLEKSKLLVNVDFFSDFLAKKAIKIKNDLILSDTSQNRHSSFGISFRQISS